LTIKQVIDYSTRAGEKLYKAATEPLKDSYDSLEPDLKAFLHELDTRAQQFGWNDIFDIPTDINDPDVTVNILAEYGNISLDQVQAHVATYIANPVHAVQDSAQLYQQCLMKTLTKEAIQTITIYQDDYRVKDRNQKEI
jgi:hypothetical protein